MKTCSQLPLSTLPSRVGFLMRPIGAICFSKFGDTYPANVQFSIRRRLGAGAG